MVIKENPVQTTMRGVWRAPLMGCPHMHGVQDSVDVCDMLEMTPCVYETYQSSEGCEIFREVLKEWHEMDAEGRLYVEEAQEMQR
jgi:hypothetical protein